jgi:hypothetical protein
VVTLLQEVHKQDPLFIQKHENRDHIQKRLSFDLSCEVTSDGAIPWTVFPFQVIMANTHFVICYNVRQESIILILVAVEKFRSEGFPGFVPL